MAAPTKMPPLLLPAIALPAPAVVPPMVAGADALMPNPAFTNPAIPVPADGRLSLKRAMPLLEETFIRAALKQTKGNRTRAAELLEISHRALLYKIKEYGIDADAEGEKPA